MASILILLTPSEITALLRKNYRKNYLSIVTSSIHDNKINKHAGLPISCYWHVNKTAISELACSKHVDFCSIQCTTKLLVSIIALQTAYFCFCSSHLAQVRCVWRKNQIVAIGMRVVGNTQFFILFARVNLKCFLQDSIRYFQSYLVLLH